MWLVFVTKNNFLGPHFLRALESKGRQEAGCRIFIACLRAACCCFLANNENDLRSRVLGFGSNETSKHTTHH